MRISQKHISHRRREQTHCLLGHPLSGDNLQLITRKDNSSVERKCKMCVSVRYEKDKEKIKENAIHWKNNNPKGRKIIQRKNNLKRLYGISLTEYETMFSKRDGLCDICKKGDIKHLSVDHDHKTGKVRGLLCRKCNVGLGIFQDDIQLIIRAGEYLAKGLLNG